MLIMANAARRRKTLAMQSLRQHRCEENIIATTNASSSLALSFSGDKNNKSNTWLAKMLLPFAYLLYESNPQFPSNCKWLPDSHSREIKENMASP